MEWPLNDPSFSTHNLDRVFVYEPRPNQGVYQFVGDEYITEQCVDSENLSAWLEEISSRKSQAGLAVILANRAELKGPPNPSILEYLPFSRDEFEKITSILPLHGDTARLINRSDTAYFNDITLTDDEHSQTTTTIFHYARTPSRFPLSLAISSVFYPATGFTGALILGCTPELTEEISARLDNAEDTFSHPLLLYGILAEIELKRHVGLVRDKVGRLLMRVHVLNEVGVISEGDGTVRKEDYSVDLWIEVSQLRMALRNWKVELGKLERCVTGLEGVLVPDRRERVLGHRREDSGVDTCVGEGKEWRGKAAEAGRRMRKRLGDITREYDQMIGECGMVLDGMALSAQLSWSQIGYQDTQANLKIANDTRRDSSRMRSIAFLTMIFLPATFIASLFSTTFFDFSAENPSNIISPYVWVYPVVTVVVTTVVVGIWIFFTARKRRSEAVAAALREKTTV